jgi:pilus assembly protein FimV
LQRWALTATLLGTIALTPLSAWSLTLGGMRVQSALGEPLRAQLSLGQLTPEELSSINAGFAPAAVYQAAGITANPILDNVQISVDASEPSNVVVNLTSSSPISEPFLDMLLEIKWASGKVVRDYTLLFNPSTAVAATVSTKPVIAAGPAVTDPAVALPAATVVEPNTAAGPVVDAAPAAPTPAAATPAAPEPATAVAAAEPAPTPTPTPTPTPEPTPAPAPAPEPAAQAAPVVAQAAQTAPQRLRVVRGDTAAALAQANLPSGVSLDQMLQAMLAANPGAFVDNNVNRLKSGAQLTVPTAEEAQAIDPAQARRLVIAQSKDFNAYRRGLAANAPTPAVSPAAQEASGTIETQVQDKAEPAPVPDQLTLSKGSVATGAEAEAQIAAAKQAQDEQAQQADLTRNIDELKALAEATPGATAQGTAPADSSSGPTVAPAPEAPVPAPEPAPTPPPASAIEQLMAQPWTLPAAFGLLAVLIGLGISRMSRRQRSAPAEAPLANAPSLAANDDSLSPTPANGLNFNLDDINLDLTPSEPAQPESEGANSEALFTKFELAKEFLSLGDRVAAKALAEEVQADATGLLKRRAELFLADLG